MNSFIVFDRNSANTSEINGKEPVDPACQQVPGRLQGRWCRISSGLGVREAEEEIRVAEPQLTKYRRDSSLVLGVPWGRTGNHLFPEGINSEVFICLQHSPVHGYENTGCQWE